MFQAMKRFLTPELIDINAFGVKFPSVQEAKFWTDQTFHSQDLGYLEQFEFQLLFTPDDTRLGYSHHSLIEDGVPLAGAYTQDTFAYWVQETAKPDGTVERLPVPIRQEGQPAARYFPPSLKIKGEVHAIRPYQFQALDDYKRNKKVFRRQRVHVLVPYKVLKNDNLALKEFKNNEHPLGGKNNWFADPEKVYVLRAWMYIGVPEFWNDLLDAGFRGFKSVNRYESRRPWLKEYYDFPKHPLEE